MIRKEGRGPLGKRLLAKEAVLPGQSRKVTILTSFFLKGVEGGEEVRVSGGRGMRGHTEGKYWSTGGGYGLI